MKYEAEIIAEILEKRGHEKSSLHYQSECIETWIEETKGAYPKLCDYESEWLNYINENPVGEFPYETITDVTEATVNNVVPYAYKTAILKGNTIVNIAKIAPKFITINLYSSSENLKIAYNLQPNKKYIIIGEISENNAPNKGLCTWVTHTDDTEAFQMNYLTNTGKFFYLYNVTKEIKTFRLYIHGDDRNNGGSITFGNVMIIEYQDGMENWDIPYFTGMQSVKMPVLKTTGKNLFDLRRMNESSYIGNSALNEINLEENSVATTNRNTFVSGRGYVITGLKIGVPYTVTATLDEISNTTGFFQIGNRQGTGHYEQRQSFTPGQTKSWKVYSDVGSLRLSIVVDRDVSNHYIKFKNIQIEEGSTATSYEPYKSNILSAPSDLELRGIGEVRDTLDCLSGQVTERTSEIVLNGGENWIKWGSGFLLQGYLSNPMFVNGTTTDIRTSYVKCDRFPSTIYSDIYNGTSYGVGINGVNIGISVNGISTLEAFKTNLSENPIKICYPVANESIKTVDLTITNQDGETLTKLTPIEGTMHISTNGTPIKPTVSMEIPVEAITQNLASFIEGE